MKLHDEKENTFWTLKKGLSELKATLKNQGFVLFKAKSSEELISIGKEIGSIHLHPDSDTTGLTQISHKNEYDDVIENAKNKLGLTQGELIPHTDRSGSETPPKYLIFWISKPAPIGGKSLFVDGHKLFEKLSTQIEANAAEPLMRPKSVVFRDENGFLESSFFSKISNSLMIRFRYDHMVYTSPDVSKILPKMVEEILASATQLKLNEGEGYILDNHRWLHGRTQFIGDRLAFRLLVDEIQ